MQPYTYLIGWSEQDLWYYGVQFGEKSDPKNLWNTYFTSSKKVELLREKIGEPDIVQVRKIFSTADSARLWETKVIRKIGAVDSDKWLNQTDNTGNFFWQGPRPERTEEHKEKLAASHRGKKISDDHSKKLHEGRRNSKNSIDHIEAYRKANLGKKRTEEAKQKMRIAKLNDPNLKERSSIAGKISAEKRKSDPEYKRKHSEKMKLWWAERKMKEGIVNGD
jgi:hypothetical protein